MDVIWYYVLIYQEVCFLLLARLFQGITENLYVFDKVKPTFCNFIVSSWANQIDWFWKVNLYFIIVIDFFKFYAIMYNCIFSLQCHQNKTLYNLLHLKNVYDVEELKNWREEYGIGDFIASLKNKIQLDDNLRNIQILSPQAEQELLQLAESKLSDLNLTQYTQLMQEQITNLDLDMFIQKLKRVQSRLGREPQSSAVRAAIGNENLYLEQMQRVVVDLQMGIRQVSFL